MPHRLLAICVWCLISLPVRGAEPFVALEVDADALQLRGPSSRYQLLVHGRTPEGERRDLTRDVQIQIDRPEIVSVDVGGTLRGLKDGTAKLSIRRDNLFREVTVTVRDSQKPREFHFENDILPLLNRYGCNSSGCHGKAEGQNGFKLSVFGFDPPSDYASLLKEGRGRRILPSSPEQSLLLTKASGRVAHGGGNRIPVHSEAYQTFKGWIAAGVPVGSVDAPKLEKIRVEPQERVMLLRGQQQLRVTAVFSDGRELDVTSHARFQSNRETVAVVSADGLVATTEVPGEVAIMAGYLNEVSVFRAIVPRPQKIDFPKLPHHNFIDPLVDAKLKKLNLIPSGGCDDATFLRRVSLDIIGTLPTPDEVRAFLKDTDPGKRSKLVDALLERPEYAEYWALKWSDILRVDRGVLGHERAYDYYRWIRDSLQENKPFDQFARELVTAEGLLDEVPAANFFRVVSKPGEAASTLSQVFLGVRIGCAECHHHPFDRWSQTDYYGMAAFFSPLSVKKIGPSEAVVSSGESMAKHQRTGEPVRPRPLSGVSVEKETEPRQRLAEWLTAPENPWFARTLANRMWAHFLGRGIIDPVDDVRATNPPTNPELLDALAKHLIESKYDLKKMIRTITASRVYQTSSLPNETNDKDQQNHSRAMLKRLDAEVLLDMVSQTTGVPEKFQGTPSGYRAIQLWDSKVPHYFLKLFGRPVRASVCECERVGEPNVSQVLHLLNSPEIDAKLRHADGTLSRLLKKFDNDAALVEELYLAFYARRPTDDETTTALKHLKKSPDRKKQLEDLAWALMNSLEFTTNH